MHMRIYYFREALAPQITTRYASLGMRAALQRPSQLFFAHNKLFARSRDARKGCFCPFATASKSVLPEGQNYV